MSKTGAALIATIILCWGEIVLYRALCDALTDDEHDTGFETQRMPGFVGALDSTWISLEYMCEKTDDSPWSAANLAKSSSNAVFFFSKPAVLPQNLTTPILNPTHPNSLQISPLSARKLYANIDWTQPKYYDASKAVAIGSKIYYISRGVDGVFISEFDTSTLAWRSLPEYIWLTDADGWDAEMRYATIRAEAVGSKMYLFGRGGTGTYLSSYDTVTETWALLPSFAFLRDADGFTLPQYYDTVRMVALSTKLYITARGNNRINLAAFDTVANTWSLLPALIQFTDDTVWNNVTYYNTFRLISYGTNLWLYCRGPGGVNLISYSTTGGVWAGSMLTYLWFQDAASWGSPCYYETTELLGLGNRIYMLARGSANVYMAVYDIVGNSFSLATYLPYYTDGGGWSAVKYYEGIRATVCNNGIYTAGRGLFAVYAAKYISSTWTITTSIDYQYGDATGWGTPNGYRAVKWVCSGTKLYFVGRNLSLLKTGVYNTVGDTWNTATDGYFPCYNTCQQCIGSVSSSCSQCFALSHLQTTSPSACVCDSHYYPNPDVRTCSPCYVLCAECSGGADSQCTQCYSNAALVSPPTSKCACVTSYYLDSTNVCSPCHGHCQDCTSAAITQCSACKSNSHLLTPLVSECVCNSGYFFTATNVCNLCNATCMECSNSGVNDCTQCKTNASLITPPTSACKCNSGYFMDATSTCVHCHVSCKECSGATASVCTQCPMNAHLATPPTSACVCDSGYYYDTGLSACTVCHLSCAACNGAGMLLCTQCRSNGYLSSPPVSSCLCSTGYYMVTPSYVCTLCDQSCAACSGAGPTLCTQCHTNGQLSSPPTSTCVCNTGYYMDSSGLCAVCHPQCVACIAGDSLSCKQCGSNANLVSPPTSACVCVSSFYMSPTNVCTACHPRCQECQSNLISQCSQCKANSHLSIPPISTCDCDTGYYFSASNICIACHPSCLACNAGSSSFCSQCKTNSHLVTPSVSACQCDSGFYMDANSDCQVCSPPCVACSGAGPALCTQCLPNATLASPSVSPCVCDLGFAYNLSNTACVLCNSLCLTCSGVAANACTSCHTNAELESSPVSACVCSNGYYMTSSAVCAACDQTCSTCNAPLASDCLSCKATFVLEDPTEQSSKCVCLKWYYLTVSGFCDRCDVSCGDCSGAHANQCVNCKDNAMLQNDFSCRCNDGYFWDESAGICGTCDATCGKCIGKGDDSCIECRSKAFLITSAPAKCVCNPGSFPDPDASSCTPCAPLCSKCSTLSNCLLCSSNADFSDTGKCDCNLGYFLDAQNNVCKPCSIGCAKCESDSQCSVCVTSKFLLAQICVDVCPADFIAYRHKCIKEPPTPNLSVNPSNVLTLNFSKIVTKSVENSDIELAVPDLDGQNIPISWNISTVKAFQTYAISLQFFLKTPPDNSTLYLIFTNPPDFHDSYGSQILLFRLNVTLFPIRTTNTSGLEMTMKSPSLSSTASTVSQGGVASAAAMSILGGNPTALFGLLNQLQLICYIPLMDIDLPDDLYFTLTGLNSNNFAMNPMGYVFSYDSNSTKPSNLAQKYGFQTTLFLMNSGFIVTCLAGLAVSYAVVSLLSMMKSVPVVAIYFTETRGKFQWGIPVRMWIQLYLDIGVNSLLQYSKAFSFNSNWELIVNASVSGLVLICFVVTPALLIQFIWKNRKAMIQRADSAFKKKWGVLFMEFKDNCKEGGLLHYFLFTIRRLFYAASLILLSSFPSAQMGINITCTIVVRNRQVLTHLIAYRPYAGFVDQASGLLVEITTLTVFCISASFLNVEKSSIRSKLSTACKIVIFSGIGLNTVLSIAQLLITLKRLIKRYKQILAEVHKTSLRPERLFRKSIAKPKIVF